MTQEEDRFRRRTPDQELAREAAPLLFRLSFIAILIPIIAAVTIWIWGFLTGHHFSHKEIRLLCLLVWLATLVVLSIAAIGGRHGPRSLRGRDGRYRSYVPLQESQTPMHKWEQRNARRLLLKVCGAALAVPLLSFAVIMIYAVAKGMTPGPRLFKAIAPFLWGGGILGGVVIAARSTKEQLIYSRGARPSGPADDEISFEAEPEEGPDYDPEDAA